MVVVVVVVDKMWIVEVDLSSWEVARVLSFFSFFPFFFLLFFDLFHSSPSCVASCSLWQPRGLVKQPKNKWIPEGKKKKKEKKKSNFPISRPFYSPLIQPFPFPKCNRLILFHTERSPKDERKKTKGRKGKRENSSQKRKEKDKSDDIFFWD